MNNDIINNLDIYEVDKKDYEGLAKFFVPDFSALSDPSLWIDAIGQAMPANRYFIFNFMDEQRLGPYKYYKYIQLSEKEYLDFLKRLQKITEGRKEDA